ncbi:MAG: hypothetical protein GWM92_21730 [Gemmatimonadetes bacterium]|nr:DUF192 domain-containing protein [Gemmatimonadota bacterium]NIR81469.1 DUF192 domain-containing protein [Gemmatimonadota bacterium]NIT90314.1 DUF192 domain-containing protein [Gemmatimonadota bacterium]NIU34134.1 DUF192 domain-containing protein [Gemmatimonadota bacterium]NIU38290.1 hypothetical protein [Gemmatimonadota bacterium]
MTPPLFEPGASGPLSPSLRLAGIPLLAVACTLVTGAASACYSPNGDAEGSTGTGGADTLPGSGNLPEPGMAWVILGGDTVRAEVADSPEERERGLMNRTSLGEDEGMLFVFQDEEVRSFWMRNTYVPLDIAFLDSALEVVDIQQMEPETEEFYESARPAMFAVEVAQGWMVAHGVDVGDQAEIVFGSR